MSTWRVPGLRLKLQSTGALYADKIGLSSPAVGALCVHSLLRARIGPIFQQRASILRAILLSKARSRDTFQVMEDPGILLTRDRCATIFVLGELS